MTDRLIRRLCLLAALLFSLASCATGPTPQADSVGQDTRGGAAAPVLSIVFCAATKGYYEPCPT